MNAGDIEAFLATQPSRAAHRLSALRRFFRFAARHAGSQQRQLLRRWTSGRDDVHPHEAAGLLARIHGATTQEIRQLAVDATRQPRPCNCRDCHTRPHSTRGPGPRPSAAFTTARLTSDYPHLLVTRVTKATRAPANAHYVKNTVAPAGVRPRILRSSRLLAMVSTAGPKLVAEAFGMTRDAVTAYLADRIDPTRLADL